MRSPRKRACGEELPFALAIIGGREKDIDIFLARSQAETPEFHTVKTGVFTTTPSYQDPD